MSVTDPGVSLPSERSVKIPPGGWRAFWLAMTVRYQSHGSDIQRAYRVICCATGTWTRADGADQGHVICSATRVLVFPSTFLVCLFLPSQLRCMPWADDLLQALDALTTLGKGKQGRRPLTPLSSSDIFSFLNRSSPDNHRSSIFHRHRPTSSTSLASTTRTHEPKC